MRKVVIGGIAIIVIGILLLTAGALLLENNPPVVQEPKWDSPQTRALAVKACFDCHSNQTNWAWWTKVPVGSWIAVFDTVRGRRELNFSEWGTSTSGEGRRVNDIGRTIQRGSMPPASYLLLHPEARLTDAEKQQLISGFQNTLGQ
jgi:hypothetical protein